MHASSLDPVASVSISKAHRTVHTYGQITAHERLTRAVILMASSGRVTARRCGKVYGSLVGRAVAGWAAVQWVWRRA